MENLVKFEFISELRKTIVPLRLIFWGGIIVLIDISVIGIDILNDLIGEIFIIMGCIRLAFLSSNANYERGMTFVSLIAMLTFFIDMTAITNSEVLIEYEKYLQYFSALQALAIIIFCFSMKWFCEFMNLKDIADHWDNTNLTFTFFLIIPNALINLFSKLYYNNFISDYNTKLIIVLVMFIFGMLPLIQILTATKKMLKVAELYRPKTQSVKGAI